MNNYAKIFFPVILGIFLVGIIMVPNAFAIQDRGDFYFTYDPTQNYQGYEDWLKETGYFELQIEGLNSIFKLPSDIDIFVVECGVDEFGPISNAFYVENQIVICYELIAETDDRFTKYYEREFGYNWQDSIVLHQVICTPLRNKLKIGIIR